MVSKTDAKQILQFAIDAGIDVFLDGGWGVDALLGQETRVHNDIDLFVEKKDYPNFIQIISEVTIAINPDSMVASPYDGIK